MKVAILGEADLDEMAIAEIAKAVQPAIGSIDPYPVRARGWPSVINLLPTVIKALHCRCEVDALIVCADTDDTPVHRLANCVSGCRLCELKAVCDYTLNGLTPIANRNSLNLAIATPPPAIEAWYLCGVDNSCTEAEWIRKFQSGTTPFHEKQRLKRIAYGRTRSVARQRQLIEAHAKRLAADFSILCRSFPATFGSFAQALENWAR